MAQNNLRDVINKAIKKAGFVGQFEDDGSVSYPAKSLSFHPWDDEDLMDDFRGAMAAISGVTSAVVADSEDLHFLIDPSLYTPGSEKQALAVVDDYRRRLNERRACHVSR